VQPGHTGFKAEKPLDKQAPTEEISLCKAVKAVVFSQAYKQSGGLRNLCKTLTTMPV
jgi:hypothetical protein